jgi:acetyl esterase/lipase
MASESRDIEITRSKPGPHWIAWCISAAVSLLIVNPAAYADPRSSQAVAGANACPRAELKMPSIPSDRPPGPPGVPKITVSSTVAASDASTSTVIRPDPKDQITCGRTSLKSIDDVIFSKPRLSSGKTADLQMDVQIPLPSKKRPLVVYVTGGGFVLAAKEAALELRTYVAEAGFVVASVQYRTLSDGANYRDSIEDIKSAVRYLRANADKFDVDPDKVAVWGESAGGYLAAMVGLTNGYGSFDVGANLNQSSAVQAVVDKFGPSNATKLAADFDAQSKAWYASATNPVSLYMGADAAAAANPLTYVGASKPPFLFFHGTQDRLVSPTQTLILHNALSAAGSRSIRYVLEGAGHGDMSFMGDSESGLPWSTKETMGIIVDFLRASIGGGEHK